MIAYCLADLFNLDLWPSGRPPNYADVREGIDEFVNEIVLLVPSAIEVTIRLYGGWHGDTPTTRVDLRQMVHRAIDALPKRRAAQRLRMQLADHPVWNPSIRMLRSVRISRPRRVRVTLTPSRACSRADRCTLPILRSWVSGACPDSTCIVGLRQVAQQRRQKMVDTLLTVDAMTIAHHALADSIIIASDDDDMMPALLALTNASLPVTYLRRSHSRRPSSSYYVDILESEGVAIHHW